MSLKPFTRPWLRPKGKTWHWLTNKIASAGHIERERERAGEENVENALCPGGRIWRSSVFQRGRDQRTKGENCTARSYDWSSCPVVSPPPTAAAGGSVVPRPMKLSEEEGKPSWLAHSMEKSLSISWMIGCHCWNEQTSGMPGLWMRNWYSWLNTVVDECCKSSTFSQTMKEKHSRKLPA